MHYKIIKKSPVVLAVSLLMLCPIFSQEYIFEGDPQLVYEEGNFKQNYNTGLFFFNTRQWDIAIKFFKRCNELTRKKTIHYRPLTWSYIYTGQYKLARESYTSIKSKKHKQIVRLVIKELQKFPKRKKVSKKYVDRVYNNKIELIKKTKRNIIAFAKLRVIDYGL